MVNAFHTLTVQTRLVSYGCIPVFSIYSTSSFVFPSPSLAFISFLSAIDSLFASLSMIAQQPSIFITSCFIILTKCLRSALHHRSDLDGDRRCVFSFKGISGCKKFSLEAGLPLSSSQCRWWRCKRWRSTPEWRATGPSSPAQCSWTTSGSPRMPSMEKAPQQREISGDTFRLFQQKQLYTYKM